MHDVAMHYCESGVGKLRSLSLSVVMLLNPIPISFLLSSPRHLRRRDFAVRFFSMGRGSLCLRFANTVAGLQPRKRVGR